MQEAKFVSYSEALDRVGVLGPKVMKAVGDVLTQESGSNTASGGDVLAVGMYLFTLAGYYLELTSGNRGVRTIAAQALARAVSAMSDGERRDGNVVALRTMN